jgi:hypothetical protein
MSRRLLEASTLKGPPRPAERHTTKRHRSNVKLGGGTYGAEREIAYDALRAAGYSESEATRAIQEADQYFKSIGVDVNTLTRVPGNRY